MARVKGTKITSKMEFVRDVFGEEGVQQVLDALGPDERGQVRRALEIGWYDQELYDGLIQAILAGPGDGDERVLDRMGAYSADRQSEQVYSVYFRSRDPRAVIEGMIPMHRMLNDPGEMSVERRGDGHLSLVVQEPPGDPKSCRVARSFYQRAVELCGVDDVTVREVECSGVGAGQCRFEVRWTAPS
ncbi:MAG: DUF2378 family protein [Thermoanaerobaculia bacterium]